MRFHDMTRETLQTIRASILGSVALLPLLVLPSLVGALVDHAGFTEAEAGWVAAVGFAGSALGAIIAGLRIRHFDPRMLAITGLVLLAVFDGASIFAGQLPTWLFVTFRFVSGLGGAIAYAAVMATIATMSNPERDYGIFMVFQFGLSAIGLYWLPYLLPVIGGVAGLFSILAVAAVLSLLLRNSVIHREAVAEETAVEIKTLLKPAALMAMFGIGLYETANLGYYTYSERIGLSMGLNDYQVGEVLGVATLLGVPSAFGVVWLGDRFGQLKPLFLALLHYRTTHSCLSDREGQLFDFHVHDGRCLGVWACLLLCNRSPHRSGRKCCRRWRILYIQWRCFGPGDCCSIGQTGFL